MIPRPAQYMLRFDDLCPTMNRALWPGFEALIREFALAPMLAVVPANRDPDLIHDAADPVFWQRLRALESAGATIALHGYTHLCRSPGRGLLPLSPCSEFAGIPAETQRIWICRGLEILRSHRLTPRLFVAPRHGFDNDTLGALHGEGIRFLSDGFARGPFLRSGTVWIPQQLWQPKAKQSGLWTICVHPNTANDASMEELRAFLREHAAQFTSFCRVQADFPERSLTWNERLVAAIALRRLLVRRRLRQGCQPNTGRI